jgi:protein TonB
MKYLLSFIFIIFTFSVSAQIDTTKQKSKPPNLRHKLPKMPKEEISYGMPLKPFYENMPLFFDCDSINNYVEKKSYSDSLMLGFIYENICYPDSARKNGIEGIVVISFIINKDGSILNPIIRRNIGGGCDEEALRIVNLFPKFTPAKRVWDDEKVELIESPFNLPIKFRLE